MRPRVPSHSPQPLWKTRMEFPEIASIHCGNLLEKLQIVSRCETYTRHWRDSSPRRRIRLARSCAAVSRGPAHPGPLFFLVRKPDSG